MKKNKYEDLVDNSKYQVFLMTCPTNLPSSFFARHSWFVVNRKGQLERWEALLRPNQKKPCWYKLHKNRYPYFKGVTVIPRCEKYLWGGKLEGLFEGDKGSGAEKMIKFIQLSPNKYPHSYQKAFTPIGPNCNTYTSWIISHFPESNFKLPWNAIGKNYQIKN